MSAHGDDDTVVIVKHFTILKGYKVTNEELPEKFKPHCPPEFHAFVAHTVDPDGATEEDPSAKNNNMTNLGK